MKKPSSTEARHRKEIREIAKDRQAWATRTKTAERERDAARAEVVEWKARFDTLLHLSALECIRILEEAAERSQPLPTVSRETAGKP